MFIDESVGNIRIQECQELGGASRRKRRVHGPANYSLKLYLSAKSGEQHISRTTCLLHIAYTETRNTLYNSRFLILPWVKVPNLASHLLGRVARQIAADWQALYEHPVYLLETFIDPERFAGTCYRAANWIYLGLSTGRGKDDQTNRPNRSLKQLWVYSLRPDFRRQLCGEGCG
jgi:hypothetical protein